MSFILDALKKLEQEKAARRGGTVDISAEIVRGNHRVSRTARRTGPMNATTVGVGIALLIVVVAVAFVWRHRGVVRETESPAVEVPIVPRDTVAVERPPVPSPPRREEPMPVRAAAPPAARTETLPPPPQPRPARSETAEPASPPAVGAERVEDSPQGGASGGSGGLTVSGIAWQEQRSLRRAVINGLLLSEGKTVGGARIVEIMPNSVRFSSNGRTFEVSISSAQVGK
ncbi:MAG: general secretion pathway protein GspB [Geobacteraceae bacterium]|nr:general secretion pathway protein GspB [Geobacteraceae bacterium]